MQLLDELNERMDALELKALELNERMDAFELKADDLTLLVNQLDADIILQDSHEHLSNMTEDYSDEAVEHLHWLIPTNSTE